MSGKDTPAGGLKNLSDREKRLMMGMFGVFACLIVFAIVMTFQSSMEEISKDTENYKQALDLLAVAGPEFIESKSGSTSTQSHKKLDEELLAKNTIKLTSFVAEHAAATDITISSYDEDELPFGGSGKDDGPIIVERQLRIEIRDADFDKLVTLLDRIEKSTDPVFIKRLDIRKQRKKLGRVRAVVTVSTFEKKEKES